MTDFELQLKKIQSKFNLEKYFNVENIHHQFEVNKGSNSHRST